MAMAAPEMHWWQRYGNIAQIASAVIAIGGFGAVLMQLSEIGGRNEAVAKEQQERAAEIAALEGRWKTENVADSEPSTLVSASRGFRLYLLVYCPIGVHCLSFMFVYRLTVAGL